MGAVSKRLSRTESTRLVALHLHFCNIASVPKPPALPSFIHYCRPGASKALGEYHAESLYGIAVSPAVNCVRCAQGRVESHDADAGYFRIVFEEDDSEEMSRAQLEPLLLPDVDDTDVESPPAAAEPPAAGSAAEQPRATAAAALPPPQAGEGPAKGCAARKGCKRRVVAGAPRVDAAEHADKRRKGSRAAARPAAAGKSPGRGRLPALGDANGQLPSASKRRQGEEVSRRSDLSQAPDPCIAQVLCLHTTQF